MKRVIIFNETEGKSRKGFNVKQVAEMFGIPYVNNIRELKEELNKQELSGDKI